MFSQRFLGVFHTNVLVQPSLSLFFGIQRRETEKTEPHKKGKIEQSSQIPIFFVFFLFFVFCFFLFFVFCFWPLFCCRLFCVCACICVCLFDSVFHSKMADVKTLLFQSFSSFLDVSFWNDFSKKKLDVWKLSEEPIQISGTYSCGSSKHTNLPSRLHLSSTSFSPSSPPSSLSAQQHAAVGLLHNANTIEGFKKMDKKGIWDALAAQIWRDITSGDALERPELLARFVIFTFGDLKKYNFSYMCGFPALKSWGNSNPACVGCGPISSRLSEKQTNSLREQLFVEIERVVEGGKSTINKGFFLAALEEEEQEQEGEKNGGGRGGVVLYSLNQIETWLLSHSDKHRLAVFADPSSRESHPGWPLRNYLSLLHFHSKKLGKPLSTVSVLCLRHQYPAKEMGHSIVVEVRFPDGDLLLGEEEEEEEEEKKKVEATGWEKDPRGKVAARTISLADSMDPVHLTQTAVGLNLKLMRWRIMPSLDLERIASMKCLIVGSGTLGCNVARNLLGWGVNTITLVDNGRVSLSNPVRQSLFTFEDSREKRYKSVAAAANLKLIFPTVDATGHVLSIPMPGHSVSEKTAPQVEKEVNLFCDLVDQHDVVFLLTDSRESRWFPTMISSFKQKIVINAAMGFDTFLCMRHGHGLSNPTNLEIVASETKNRLGCYFCNDVVAPQDSLKDRTLDQQCTVTRPGLSSIVAATAVELAVSISQHPMGEKAPADDKTEVFERTKMEMGLLPHQIRGYFFFFFCDICYFLFFYHYLI